MITEQIAHKDVLGISGHDEGTFKVLVWVVWARRGGWNQSK